MLNPNVPGFGKTKWMFSAGRKEKRKNKRESGVRER